METKEETIFTEGMRVEVRDNNEGYGGAWFTATVISTPSSPSPVKKKKSINPPQPPHQMYLVKYDHLVDDQDPVQPLKELVHFSSIRPIPPNPDTTVGGDGDHAFELNDVVDAFHQEGWWPGVVRDFAPAPAPADGGGGGSGSTMRCFLIDFDHPPDQKVCPGFDLRFHFDWVDGDWVRPGKQSPGDANSKTAFTPSLKKFKARNPVKGQLSVTPPRRAMITRNKDANSNTDVTQGSKKFKSSNAVKGQPSITPPCRPVITQNNDDSSGFTTAAKGGKRNDCSKQSSDDGPLSAENKSRTRKKTESKEQIVGVPKSATGHKRKKRRATKMPYSKRSNARAKGNEGNTTEDSLENEHIKNVMFAKETQGSEAENSHLLPEKASSKSVRDQDPHAMEPESTMEISKSIGEESLVRKKRGRPRKSFGKILNGSAEGKRHEVAVGALNQTVLKDGATNVKAFRPQVRKDFEDLRQGKSSANVIDDEMPSQLSDEQPLLTWLDGMKSAKVLNNGGISHGMALNPRDDVSDGQNDVATPTQSPEVVNCDTVEKSGIILPFAKCSPVWNSIESLEVFQKTPQRPHFSPLGSCKEDSREGIAIGHMVTFANLVERTLKLQPSDPQSTIVSTLETLAELENHGFDVESVRKRLIELQALKVRVDQLEYSSKEAESVIMKLNLEKRELEELMDKVEKKMREIQEKLAAAATMKETKVGDIDVWQSKVISFVDSVESAKRDFERVAASPLWDV